MHFDLNAPIIAGQAAAGFNIGGHIQDYETAFAGSRVLQYKNGFNFVQEIEQNSGVLRIEGFENTEGPSIYYGPDTIRLVFTSSGLLGCIYVFSGYMGTYGQARINAPLSSVSQIEPLEYDSGDEMYYRVDENGDYISGLAIVAMEVSPPEHANTPILGFSIHDWSLFT